MEPDNSEGRDSEGSGRDQSDQSDSMAEEERLKTHLRGEFHRWTPVELVMEVAHSICCTPCTCKRALMNVLRELFDAREEFLSAAPLNGLLYPSDVPFCLHLPGFIASTPLLGMITKCFITGAKMAPKTQLIGHRPIFRPDVALMDLERMLFRDTFEQSGSILNSLIASNHSVIPYIFRAEPDFFPSLFGALTYMLTISKGERSGLLERTFAVVISVLAAIMSAADATHYKKIHEAAKSNKAFFKLVKKAATSREQQGADWSDVAIMLTFEKSGVDRSTIKYLLRQVCGKFSCDVGAQAIKCMDIPTPTSETKTLQPLFACARCKRIKYCSAECQKSDWKWHKAFCGLEGMPKPEDVGLAPSWRSQTCLLSGGSEQDAQGVDLDGFYAHIKRLLD